MGASRRELWQSVRFLLGLPRSRCEHCGSRRIRVLPDAGRLVDRHDCDECGGHFSTAPPPPLSPDAEELVRRIADDAVAAHERRSHPND